MVFREEAVMRIHWFYKHYTIRTVSHQWSWTEFSLSAKCCKWCFTFLQSLKWHTKRIFLSHILLCSLLTTTDPGQNFVPSPSPQLICLSHWLWSCQLCFHTLNSPSIKILNLKVIFEDPLVGKNLGNKSEKISFIHHGKFKSGKHALIDFVTIKNSKVSNLSFL